MRFFDKFKANFFFKENYNIAQTTHILKRHSERE